jgi:uncharacterized cofD-like protein
MVSNLNICTVGGGSGMPVVNTSLVLAGFKNIKSIVTTFDQGGDTGRIRTDERGQVLAFSDYWRSLISLWPDGDRKKTWEEILRYRDGRNRNFGNTFFQFMSEKTGDLSTVDMLFSSLTGADLRGEVIPVSLRPSDICFQTVSGKIYRGEHHLDLLRMSLDRVEKVWLDPPVNANPEAIRALRQADIIIISPGSMYGSVIANFLPRGMASAYKKSSAKKFLITNIMSVANENHGYSQNDYVNVFAGYLDTPKPFDTAIMTDFSALPQKLLKSARSSYALEHSHLIVPAKKSATQTLVLDVAIIEPENLRLRHSSEKLAVVWRKLLI